MILFRSDQDIREDWRNGRDKLALDYKRKRKDVSVYLDDYARHMYE
jgi:hypothetical protein